MRESELEELIQGLRLVGERECPGVLEQNVLRRIRLAKEEAGGTAVDWLLGLLPRRGVQLAALLGVVTLSSGMTMVSVMAQTTVERSQSVASQALDFDVFARSEILNFGDW